MRTSKMICEICGKSPQQSNIGRHLHSGKWRHRGPQTQRVVFPNIQKINNKHICTACLRTQNKQKSSKV